MTWPTSVAPWTHHACAAARGNPSLRTIKSLFSHGFDGPAVVATAVASHVLVLAATLQVSGGDLGATLALLTGLTTAAITLRALSVPAPSAPVATPAPVEAARAGEPIVVPLPEASVTRTPPAPPPMPSPEWADLMSRVSHELRTPLNAVLGFSDLMDRGLFGPLGHERYEEYVRHIHESGRELLKSAEDTLAVTSLLADPSRHAPTEVVDLAALARDAWGFHCHRATADLAAAIRIEIAPETEILADRRTVRQALVNILAEALARRQPAGLVLVSAETVLGEVRLTVSVPAARAPMTAREPGSLHACLARTLLHMHGAALHERVSERLGWSATTSFERPRQPDFFTATACGRRPVHTGFAVTA